MKSTRILKQKMFRKKCIMRTLSILKQMTKECLFKKNICKINSTELLYSAYLNIPGRQNRFDDYENKYNSSVKKTLIEKQKIL